MGPLRRSPQSHDVETTTTTTMASYKKTIATMVLASMLIATVAYAEEAQAEDHATRSLLFKPFKKIKHNMLHHHGKKLPRNHNNAPYGHETGLPSALRAARKHSGRKLQEAEQAPETEGRSLQQFFGGAPTPLPHPGLFQAGKKIGKFGRWEKRHRERPPSPWLRWSRQRLRQQRRWKDPQESWKGQVPIRKKIAAPPQPREPSRVRCGQGLEEGWKD